MHPYPALVFMRRTVASLVAVLMGGCIGGEGSAPAAALMGPLVQNTWDLGLSNSAPPDGAGGDEALWKDACLQHVGEWGKICGDVGVTANASDCAARCRDDSLCSAMTWIAPSGGNSSQWTKPLTHLNDRGWDGHCVLRFDGKWLPQTSQHTVGDVAARKIHGWHAPLEPWCAWGCTYAIAGAIVIALLPPGLLLLRWTRRLPPLAGDQDQEPLLEPPSKDGDGAEILSWVAMGLRVHDPGHPGTLVRYCSPREGPRCNSPPIPPPPPPLRLYPWRRLPVPLQH